MSEAIASLRDGLERSGLLVGGDLQVARALCRLGDESSPLVALAAALAVRAPRCGHVCVELDLLAERLQPEQDEDEEGVELAWPPLEAWLDALQLCPLVRSPEAEVATPLVLQGNRLYLDRYWRYQQRLADNLRARALQPPEAIDTDALRDGLAALYPSAAPDGRIDRQRLAAIMAVLRRLTVITGGPGTGKTTTVKRLLSLLLWERRQAEPASLDSRGEPTLRIALAAPTGKAAARLQEAIREDLAALPVSAPLRETLAQLPTFTLHRLLGSRGEGASRFRHDADNPVPYDVVVVDEASMVSLPLMAKLLDATPPAARLILLGDRDQLASVGAGAVLGDVCQPAGDGLQLSRAFARQVERASGQPPTEGVALVEREGIWDCIVQLDRFYRFGQTSGIGSVARAIQRAEGSASEVTAMLKRERGATVAGQPFSDVDLRPATATGQLDAACRQIIVEGYRPFVSAALDGSDPAAALDALDAIRVLCAHRRGRLGVEGLNHAIESWLAETIAAFEPRSVWYPGRAVMVTQNDHALRLYNGDVGAVLRKPDGELVVAFPAEADEVRLLGCSRLPPCETVFAMSIHKSQGSQFGHALVVLPQRRSPILTRELLYTAITRARDHVTVVASEPIIEATVAQRVQRASGLSDALWR